MAYPTTTGYQWQPTDAPYQRKPAPSPKGDYTNIPTDSAGAIPTLQPRQKVYPNAYPSRTVAPVAGNIEQATRIYDEMANQPIYGRDPGAGVYRPAQAAMTVPNQDSWRDRVYADREAAAARDAYSRGSEPPPPKQIQPLQAIEAPTMPKFEVQEEYKLPDEDPSVYNKARAEALNPALRALREGTREAIVTSQSLDNPNARGAFIKQALRGYGEGLERASVGAGREARQVAMDKRRETIDQYKTNYSARSNAYLANYQNTINTLAANYANQQSTAIANFNAQQNPNVEMGSRSSNPNPIAASFFDKWRNNPSGNRGQIPGYSGR